MATLFFVGKTKKLVGVGEDVTPTELKKLFFPLAKFLCLCYNISCTIFILISRTV